MSDAHEKLSLLVEQNRQSNSGSGLYADPLNRGVSVAWLAHVFRMDKQAVQRKLGNCPVKTQRRRGDKMTTTLYDLATAAPFLVTPAFSTTEYMRAVRRGDLPPALQQAVWDALLKRQKWEENAGQLWRTSAIREVLGSTFQTIKFTMQLWVDTLEKTTEVTPAQRKALIEMVDALQSDLYDSLVRNMEENQTGPQLEEMGELVGEDGTLTETVALVESEDDEIEQLI
tara:strand:- start:24108 stop:24791 length:684 start_codon:yes stop_codon:yes gene_type:complete